MGTRALNAFVHCMPKYIFYFVFLMLVNWPSAKYAVKVCKKTLWRTDKGCKDLHLTLNGIKMPHPPEVCLQMQHVAFFSEEEGQY